MINKDKLIELIKEWRAESKRQYDIVPSIAFNKCADQLEKLISDKRRLIMRCQHCKDPILKFQNRIIIPRDKETQFHEGCYEIVIDELRKNAVKSKRKISEKSKEVNHENPI